MIFRGFNFQWFYISFPPFCYFILNYFLFCSIIISELNFNSLVFLCLIPVIRNKILSNANRINILNKNNFQINVELKTESRHDKRINIVDVLKPADDVIDKHNRERERQRAFSGKDKQTYDINIMFNNENYILKN